MMPLPAMERSPVQVTTMLALKSDMNISRSAREKYTGMPALIWEFCLKCMQL